MKTIFKKIGLAVFSTILMFFVLEIGLRIIGYDALKRFKNGRELTLQPSTNNDVIYELIPNAKGYIWGTEVEINAKGYRGRMGSVGKFDGFRIIVIGDSITFGNKIPLESTYANQLHETLNKSCSNNYEVLNFGVGGYDILQEISLLEHKGLAYKPNLVVIGFCLNDVGIASPNLEYIKRVKKYKSSIIFQSRVAQFIVDKIEKNRIGVWLNEKNKPQNFLKDYKSKIEKIENNEYMLHEMMRVAPNGHPSIWYDNKYRIGRLRYAFQRLAQLAKKENFKVAIVIFPWLVGNENIYPHRMAHLITTYEAKRVGFDVIEVFDEFMAAGMENLKVSENDAIHPNHKGNEIVAKKLVKYIRKL